MSVNLTVEALSELIINHLAELIGTSEDVVRYRLEKLLDIALQSKEDVINLLLDANNLK